MEIIKKIKTRSSLVRGDIENGECYRTANGENVYMAIPTKLTQHGSVNSVSLNSGHLFNHKRDFAIKKVIGYFYEENDYDI